MTNSSGNRTYAAAHFGLELGDEPIGLFRSIEGGGIKAEVIHYQHGRSQRGHGDRWRQLGKPKFEDIKLQVGMAMSEPFYEWIAKFVACEPVRKNGAILAADFEYKERARREFTEALIKEIGFPKLDANDKNAAYMSVTLAVEGIQFKKGTGRPLENVQKHEQAQQWTACNFRFALDGFSKESCQAVTKIDPFVIKQEIIEYHSGAWRAPIKTPSQIEFPTLAFYVPESHAAPFIAHFEKRGVRGEVPTRLTGSITVFDNGRNDLLTVKIASADISGITPDKADASSEELKQVKVELYTEEMSFEYARS
jgi:phage tail-like protein